MSNNYIVATTKNWNIKKYHEVIKSYPGNWHLITEPSELTIEKVQSLQPEYIFFPHWSEIVPDSILDLATCICFHETDLPFGRGGSPIQNLIDLGYQETKVSALRMTNKLDAGPIYLKENCSLDGSAEEIFIRVSIITSKMIETIVTNKIEPKEQVGEPTIFKRRNPSQSQITEEIKSLDKLYNHIRMLDADSYPKAFIDISNVRFKFSRASIKKDKIVAEVEISELGEENEI